MKKKITTAALILAAGSGTRMGERTTKQRMLLCGESVLMRSVRAFSECREIDLIYVICREDETEWAMSETSHFTKVKRIITGGKTRAESAKIGFDSLPSDIDFVAIHDSARCLITPDEIAKVIGAAIEHGAASAGAFVTDTVKQINSGFIKDTIPREQLFLAQTPQVFSCELYRSALENCTSIESVTDDNMLVEAIGRAVYPVNVGKHNIKLTTPDDIAFAEYILERRKGMSSIRVGHGYDLHRLVEGRKLVLGGVEVPHAKGLLGHSDADVLVHAIMDALLGAAALGDIGRHFPDSDDKYKGASSIILLAKVSDLLKRNGYAIENIDATVVAQKPKLAPYIQRMEEIISETLDIDQGRVNIKATTEEGLGFTGREEGICSHAVCIIKK